MYEINDLTGIIFQEIPPKALTYPLACQHHRGLKMQGTKGLLRRLEQRTVTFELVSKWPMMNILMIYI